MTSRATEATETPVVEAEAEEAQAEVQQPSDEEIMAAINAEIASRQAASAPRQVTIAELFEQGVALIASATGKNFRGGVPRVTEQTAVRIYELTLMWALNNRGQGGTPGILSNEEIGTEPIGDDLPTPNEIIEAAPDAAEE